MREPAERGERGIRRFESSTACKATDGTKENVKGIGKRANKSEKDSMPGACAYFPKITRELGATRSITKSLTTRSVLPSLLKSPAAKLIALAPEA